MQTSHYVLWKKELQWKFPATLGDKSALMIGGMIEKLLGSSEWTTVPSQAQVLIYGRAQSMLGVITSNTQVMLARSHSCLSTS